MGILEDSFNKMTSGLALKKHYRSLLDKVVSKDIAEEMLKGNIILGGEMRNITTLFADVRGFTAFSGAAGPQKTVSVLNQYFDGISAAIEEEGGVIDKYIGDEVMAIFGAPLELADSPLSAVRAALKIIKYSEILNEEMGRRGEDPIKLGIGLNSGGAVAGNMGSKNRLNYTVIGESVNIASRLCNIAGPGEIIISGNTYEKVSDKVSVISTDTVSLKGISVPVIIYKIGSLRENA